MPGRTTLFVGILLLAIALPYLLSDEGKQAIYQRFQGNGEPLFSSWIKEESSSDAKSAAGSSPGENGVGLATATRTVGKPTQDLPPISVPPLGGAPGITLAEALNFEATPAWIAQTWPRVTTHLPTTDYHGVRVPLVTGTELHDFAGSLSYYFNAQRRVERITLTGYTGDFETLAVLVQSRFGLGQYATVGTALYLGFQENRPLHFLRIEEASLQQVSGSQTRYHVELELNLPRPGATLSEPTMTRLRKLREAKLL